VTFLTLNDVFRRDREEGMRTGIVRRLLVGALAVVAIVFVTAYAAPPLLPAGWLKSQVADFVLRRTGCELRIAGAIDVELLPRPRVTAHDLALSNPAGNFFTDFLTAPLVEISLKPLALLRGSIEIDRVRLSKPAISFEIDGAGGRNWIFRRLPTEPGATSEGSRAVPPIAFDNLIAVDGNVSYFDQRTGRKQAASNVDLTATAPALDRPLDARGTAIYNGEGVDFDLAVASPENLRDGGVSGASFDIRSARATLIFHGETAGAGPARFAGSIEVAAPSLEKIFSWIQIIPPARFPGSFSLSGQLQSDGPKLSLSDARIALGTIAAQGALTIDRAGDRPRITGHLAFDRLDVDPLLKPRPQPSGEAKLASPGTAPPETPPAAGAATSPRWSRARLDLAPLNLADVDLDLAADAIRAGRINVGPSQLGLHLRNGRLDLDITAMALYHGKGTGKLVVDGSAAVPAFGARLSLVGITVGHVPLDIAGLGELSGTGDVSLDLIGRGGNMREIAESLNGIAGFEFSDGTVGSAGLGPAMRTELGPAVPAASIPREIAYSRLSGTAIIERGVLRNGDLKLVSPRLTATASGLLDLAARRVDYLWQPDIPGLGSARIAVTGSWDAPSYKAQSITIARSPAAPAKATQPSARRRRRER
jgi:AsmA protein